MATTKQDKTAELLKMADDGIKTFYKSDTFKDYLNVLGKFHQYSSRNVMLIMKQKPHASMVAGFKSWQKNFNRNVQKGEKGISIIAGRPFEKKIEDKKTGEIQKVSGVSFFPTSVFDVTQTKGDPMPKLATELQSDNKNFEQIVDALKQTTTAKVVFKDELISHPNANGLYKEFSNEIHVKNTLSQDQQIKTLVHEIAHSHLHKFDDGISSATKEIQAESVAYCICNKLGIDSSSYSFPYLATWIKGTESKDLMSQLETVRKEVNVLSTSLDKNLHDLNKENNVERPLPITEQIKQAKTSSVEKNSNEGKFQNLGISKGIATEKKKQNKSLEK